jgi:hypothetical protein
MKTPKVIMPKFERKYILFGKEVCRIFLEEGIGAALKLARKGDVDFELFVWGENTTPADLLSAYDGQGGYAFLNESEYKRFAKI